MLLKLLSLYLHPVQLTCDHSRTGYKGVHANTTGLPFRAIIDLRRAGGPYKHLGTFATKVDAAVAHARALVNWEEHGQLEDVDEPEQQEPETAAPVGVRTRGGSGAGVRCGCDKCGEALKLNTWFDARTRITCNGCDKDLIDGDTARSQVEITPRR